MASASLCLCCAAEPRQETFGAPATGGQSTAADSASTSEQARATFSDTGGGAADASDADDELKLDVASPGGEGPSGAGCANDPPGGSANLRGQVFAPNGTLPISGALVWVEDNPHPGIPDEVYCESCVNLPCDRPHTVSAADGTFDLSLPPGTHFLLVQKGHFLRQTEVVVRPGKNLLEVSASTLPSRRDPQEGMWTPNIALGWGEYDRLENGLAKLGLAQEDNGVMVGGTERFDIWHNHSGNQGPPVPNGSSRGTFGALISDPEAMDKYHIIFVPCTSSPDEALLNEPQIRDNIRAWVEKGGKWYVSDWSLAFLEKPFPAYQTWWQDAFTGGPLLDEFDTTGTVLDDGLHQWLSALPPELKDINPINPGGGHPTVDSLPQIDLVDLWSTIDTTPSVWTEDGRGGAVDVGHKVWIEGPGGGRDGAPANEDWPLTVTGEYGCGRMMFTSYHTVEWVEQYEGLTPQELVLAYLILEIGTCQVPYQPPPEG